MMTSNPWNSSGKLPVVETVSFADIMSEDYAKKLQNEEQKRYAKAAGKQWKEEQESMKAALDADAELNELLVDDEQSNLAAAVENDTTSSTSKKVAKKKKEQKIIKDAEGEWEDYSDLLEKSTENSTKSSDKSEVSVDPCCDDAEIAKMLQSQFDHEYNEEIRRIEEKRNKHSKVTISLDKFKRNGDLEFLENEDGYTDEEDEEQRSKRDWDRFETNEKVFEKIPKRGFTIDEDSGEKITKHDENICGVRNACRVMAFPPHFPTGDGAGFEMKLSNRVFNELKTYSRRVGPSTGKAKKNKAQDRKEHLATAEMGVDGRTRLLLYKFVNNQILEQINGIISTGKEAIILHANSDPNYTGQCDDNFDIDLNDDNPKAGHSKSGNKQQQQAGGFSKSVFLPPELMPEECAVKVFRTTLNEFKQRDRYIKDDYRFKDRFSSQNHRVVINMWAEKEMHNLKRMRAVGINCPDVVILKKHILVMSFVGSNHNAAPKLKDARLSEAELSVAYEEITQAMHKLYNEAKLVHADLSEYNILWFDGKCFFIDVAQSVEPEHPSALEFLMRDCSNIINFFSKRGLSNIFTKEQLFEHITSLNAESFNAGMLERIHTRGASIAIATAPNQDTCPADKKPIEYPFEVAWEKSIAERLSKAETINQEQGNLEVSSELPSGPEKDTPATLIPVADN